MSSRIKQSIFRSFDHMGPQEPREYMFMSESDNPLRLFIEDRPVPDDCYINSQLLIWAIAFDREDVFYKYIPTSMWNHNQRIVEFNRMNMFKAVINESNIGLVLQEILTRSRSEMLNYLVEKFGGLIAESINTLIGGYYSRTGSQMMRYASAEFIRDLLDIGINDDARRYLFECAVQFGRPEVAEILGGGVIHSLNYFFDIDYDSLVRVKKFIAEDPSLDWSAVYPGRPDMIRFVFDHYPQVLARGLDVQSLKWLAIRAIHAAERPDLYEGFDAHFATLAPHLQRVVRAEALIHVVQRGITLVQAQFIVETLKVPAGDLSTHIGVIDNLDVYHYLSAKDPQARFPATYTGDADHDIQVLTYLGGFMYPELVEKYFLREIGRGRNLDGLARDIVTNVSHFMREESVNIISHILPLMLDGCVDSRTMNYLTVEANAFETFELLVRHGKADVKIDEGFELPPPGHPWRKCRVNRIWMATKRYLGQHIVDTSLIDYHLHRA